MQMSETPELRRRTVGRSETPEIVSNETKESNSSSTLSIYLNAAIEKAPENLKPAISHVVPFILLFASFVEQAIPIVYSVYLKCLKLWDRLAPYKPHLLLPSLIGLAICFFGGTFLTVIAAVEAYRICGYESTLRCFYDLKEDIEKFVAANQQDDKKDEDGNGTADIAELGAQQLVTRKTLLFLRTVDPRRVTDALTGISSGFMAVVATLKLQFAKAITLGTSIATMLEKPVDRYCLPILESALPPEYRRWAAPVVSYTLKSIAISVAWFIQRIISSVHAGIRGGMMFSRNIIDYLNEMGYLNLKNEDTYLDETLGYFVAFLGISFQLTRGFVLPFPMNIILFPITFLEWILVRVVASK